MTRIQIAAFIAAAPYGATFSEATHARTMTLTLFSIMGVQHEL